MNFLVTALYYLTSIVICAIIVIAMYTFVTMFLTYVTIVAIIYALIHLIPDDTSTTER